MQGLECTILRGGSSKGIYIERDLLPPPGAERDRVIFDIFGTPDVRQIDGLGGAHPLTSKVGIVSKGSKPGVDLDFLFAQLQPDKDTVDTTPNCGNMLAAVVPFALETGMIKPQGEATTLRDPAADIGRIHRVQHVGRFGIGDRPAVGAHVPGGMKAEIGPLGDADLLVRHRTEHDGAGRGAQAVDHHRQPKRNHHRRAVHRSALGFASIRRPQEGDGEGKPLRGAQIRAHGKYCLFGLFVGRRQLCGQIDFGERLRPCQQELPAAAR